MMEWWLDSQSKESKLTDAYDTDAQGKHWKTPIAEALEWKNGQHCYCWTQVRSTDESHDEIKAQDEEQTFIATSRLNKYADD